MRLPKIWTILNHKVKVIKKTLESGGYFYSDPELVIEIDTDCGEKELARRVTHEFNHAVMEISSLNDAVPDKVDEIVVNQFAKAYRDSFILLPKGLGDTVVKHYAIYSPTGELRCFHTEESINDAKVDGDLVVELYGVTKFKRARKVKPGVQG